MSELACMWRCCECSPEFFEVDDEEDTSLIQGATEHKAKRLKAASEKVDIADILGTEKDKLSRSMLASLDRMTSAEAQRCAQALLERLCELYGVAWEKQKGYRTRLRIGWWPTARTWTAPGVRASP